MGTEAHGAGPDSISTRTRRPSQLRTFFFVFIPSLAVIGTAAIAAHTIQTFHQNDLREKITRDLTQKAQAFASRLNSDRSTKIGDLTSQAAQEAGARATVIDGNGEVLADSQVPIINLEKEGSRPEFAAALRGSVGVQTRSHGPFGITVLYVAVPIPGGAVRLSTPLAEVESASTHSKNILLWGCGIAAGIALIFSAAIARIAAPG